MIDDVKTDSELKSKESLSDDELENVTGGEKKELGNYCYYVNEKKDGYYCLECPSCHNTYSIYPSPNAGRLFIYRYGVSGDNNFYCPDCYPKVKLKYIK